MKRKYFKRTKDEKNGKRTTSKENNMSDNKQSEYENIGNSMHFQKFYVFLTMHVFLMNGY